MNGPSLARALLAFVLAVTLTTVWGAIVQTQYNLNALLSIGAPIDAGVVLSTTLRDIFSGFSLTYAGYVVAPSFLVAFIVAWFVARKTGVSRWFWYAMAGTAAIGFGIPLVNWLSPLALIFGASRDLSCILLMALGGGAGGLLFTWLTGGDAQRLRAATSDTQPLPRNLRASG